MSLFFSLINQTQILAIYGQLIYNGGHYDDTKTTCNNECSKSFI